MSSQKQQGISTQPSEVSKFYEGKSLLITGAAGFLGTVFLETLLRCCPDIRRIYILLRPKGGVLPEDRKESIFRKQIFFKLKEKNPDALNKVLVIEGDVTRNDLGISSNDLHRISQEVSIVFHCAASVSFLKPLSFMMQQNLMGTKNVIDICRKLKKLDVLVYTSTAYSNSNLKDEIDEKIYKLPFTAEEAIKVLKRNGEKELMHLFSKCDPNFPNFYTFTKHLCEALIAERASDLPACIVRPSLIISSLKGVLPGYVEEGSAIVNICLGVGKGFIRVFRCDPEKKTNQIPVDIVANAHILAAYLQVVESLPSPFIYNCVANESATYTWKEFKSALVDMVLKYPLPTSYQKPSLLLCKNRVKYWIASIFDHYTPAAVIDLLLCLSGRKPRLLKLYRFFDNVADVTMHFMMNEWTFKSENFNSLSDKLNSTDKDLFPVDLTDFTLEELTRGIRTGTVYKKNNTDKFYEKQLRTTYTYYLIPLIKWSVLGCIASLFYIAVF